MTYIKKIRFVEDCIYQYLSNLVSKIPFSYTKLKGETIEENNYVVDNKTMKYLQNKTKPLIAKKSLEPFE